MYAVSALIPAKKHGRCVGRAQLRLPPAGGRRLRLSLAALCAGRRLAGLAVKQPLAPRAGPQVARGADDHQAHHLAAPGARRDGAAGQPVLRAPGEGGFAGGDERQCSASTVGSHSTVGPGPNVLGSAALGALPCSPGARQAWPSWRGCLPGQSSTSPACCCARRRPFRVRAAQGRARSSAVARAAHRLGCAGSRGGGQSQLVERTPPPPSSPADGSKSSQWVFWADGSTLAGSDAAAADDDGRAQGEPPAATATRGAAPAAADGGPPADPATCWLLVVKLVSTPRAVDWMEDGNAGTVYTLR